MKKRNIQGMIQDLGHKEAQENLSIALLLSDIEDCKDISEVFREMGIVPHFYETLKDFWQGILNKMPSLAIVDVQLMSEGERLLRHHPYVKNNQLPLCFFYSDENSPLVYSTFEIFNYGLIRRETNLRGQIKGALRRFNQMSEVKAKESNYDIQLQKVERQVTTLIAAQEQLKEEEYFKNYLDSIVQRLENKRNARDFYEAVSVVFDSVREIAEWGILELNKSGQRLVSPILESDKYTAIPSLWLGQPCREGIQTFAQNLASQVGVDLMGGELMSLMIRGKHDLPDKIILIKCENEAFLNNFEWEGLERYLSGLYSSFSLRETKVEEALSRVVNPFDLLQKMDRFNFDQAIEEHENRHLITIDFTELIQFIRNKPEVRFFWGDFFKDFIYRFENQYKVTLKVTPFNVGYLGLIVENTEKEKVFRAMKAFTSRFPYWKYFEDIDIVMVRDMPPKVRMIHYSSDAVFAMLDGQELHSAPIKIQKETELKSDHEEAMAKNIKDLTGNLKKGFFLNFEQTNDL